MNLSEPPKDFDQRETEWKVEFGSNATYYCATLTKIPDPNLSDDLGLFEPLKKWLVRDKFLRLRGISVEMLFPRQKTCRVEIKLSGTGGEKPLKIPTSFSTKGEWKVASIEDESRSTQLQKKFEEVIPDVHFGLVAKWKLVTELPLDQEQDFFENAVTIALFVCNLLGVELKKDIIKGVDKVVTWLNTWSEVRKTEYYYHGKWHNLEELRDVRILDLIESMNEKQS